MSIVGLILMTVAVLGAAGSVIAAVATSPNVFHGMAILLSAILAGVAEIVMRVGDIARRDG